MKPIAWSYSSLDDFCSCPRAFYEKRIAKSVREEQSEQMLWGNEVHKAFELRMIEKKPLPDTLAQHEDFLQRLEGLPGEFWAERKIALSRDFRPCTFFDKRTWFRGIIDYTKVHGDHALIMDYKTGKPHSKFKQLKLFALYIFMERPDVHTVHAEFYWTKTRTTTGETYSRDDNLWQSFVPDLRQYAEAFKTDTWQPRQSGLCNGWCPVKECEFWKPRRG
jgi:hypothetical protein